MLLNFYASKNTLYFLFHKNALSIFVSQKMKIIMLVKKFQFGMEELFYLFRTAKKQIVFLHAPGGCGKTWLIKQFAQYASNRGLNVYCAATTGIAAVNLSQAGIKSCTLHSWAGIGIGTFSKDKLLARVKTNRDAMKKWLGTDILVIDEVSMLGASLYDKLDFIGRNLRNKDVAFGGLPMLLCGDLLQLAPVNDKWVFESIVWPTQDIEYVTLDTPKRYTDKDYVNFLLRIRQGELSKEDKKFIKSRMVAYEKWKQENKGKDLVIKPTVIYSTKISVEHENQLQLDKIDNQEYCYTATDTVVAGKITNHEYYEKLLDDHIPSKIKLKVGAQVMLKSNIDIMSGLANGSRGVVTNVLGDIITVKFLNNIEQDITYYTWEYSDKYAVVMRRQIPLILAWSLTCHKCQGLTLDFAVCDIGPSIFCKGQAYVSLSRVRSGQSLFISDFVPKSISACKKALKMAEYIEKNGISIDEREYTPLKETPETKGIKYYI